MWVENEFTDVHGAQGTAITIGAFDGVHRGHATLIRRMVAESQHQGLVPLVVTFDPLPGQVLQPETYRLLMSPDERLAHMAALGVQGAVVLPFDRAYMETPAEDFVTRLVRHLRMRGLWVGPDFALGRGRRGNVAFLRSAGLTHHFDVHVFEETIRWMGKPVRSSRIRAALREGDITIANGCLGYPYRLSGTIGHGDRRGRELGFPTANLSVPPNRLLPANGVYVCSAHLPDGHYAAITNVGTRPTFDNGHRTVEAYLLDFAGDVYGARMHLDFLERLRPELRFTSVEALITQMERDEAAARRWFLENDVPATCRSAVQEQAEPG